MTNEWKAALAALALVSLVACSSDDGNGGGAGGDVPPGTAGAGQAAGTAPPLGGDGQPIAASVAPPAGGSGGSDVPVGGGTGAVGGETPATGGGEPVTGGGGAPAQVTGVWSHMGYDERNWYFNPTETTLSVANAGSLTEKWRFTVGGFPPGTPVVGEGKVFVMATGGTYAIDLATGGEVWSRPDITGTASAAFEPGFIYVHDATANLWKLNSADGTTVWGPSLTYSLASCDGTSSPVIAGDKVIVGHSCGVLEVGFGAAGAQGGVEAHNRSDGNKAWTYITPAAGEDGCMVWSTVGVDVASGTVYAATGNNYTAGGANSDSIHAIDLAAGTQKWVRQVRTGDTWSLFGAPGGPDTDFGANPIVATIGGQAVVAAGDKGSAFWALDANSGSILWSREGLSPSRDPAHGGILMNGAFDGTNFYAAVNNSSAGASIVYAMNASASGADVWVNNYGKFAWGAPAAANGVLVVPIDDDLHVLDASSGAELTMFNTGGTIAAGSVAIVDGMVIVQSGLQYPLDANTKNNNQVIAYGLP